MKPLLFSFLFFIGFSVGCTEPKEDKKQKPTDTIELLAALPTETPAPADNPTTPEKAELGRLLFYDPVLSGGRDVSCATCHHPEFGYAELRDLSIGVNGEGLAGSRTFRTPNDIPFVKRNSQSVLNAAFIGLTNGQVLNPATAPMFWDVRTQSLEKQALEPIKAFEEMRGHALSSDHVLDSIVARLNAIPEYRSRFGQIFGKTDAVTSDNVAKAIAAFERTLVAGNSRFDQYMRGDGNALSPNETAGMNLFLQSGCAKCHNGPMFSDFKTHVLGVGDNEKLPKSDDGTNRTYAFRTPSLRNLRFTAPYMHNGNFATLEQVLTFYEDLAGGKIENPHVKAAQLDPLTHDLKVNFKDISLIIEFLNSLNDTKFDRKIPEKVPSGLKAGGNI
ncbi:MAG: cytochrome-c peroxidase [Cytophagales bacterium]|jgi:cytochrome c peroxidase|nr:cytochrome-c peroxidase [Cytophagales bacterium]